MTAARLVCFHGRSASGCAYCKGPPPARAPLAPRPKCPSCGRFVRVADRICSLCDARGHEPLQLFSAA